MTKLTGSIKTIQAKITNLGTGKHRITFELPSGIEYVPVNFSLVNPTTPSIEFRTPSEMVSPAAGAAIPEQTERLKKILQTGQVLKEVAGLLNVFPPEIGNNMYMHENPLTLTTDDSYLDLAGSYAGYEIYIHLMEVKQ